MKHTVLFLIVLFLLPALSATASDLGGEYVDYTEEGYGEADNLERILFFHASWCPNCRQAEREIQANLDKIPDDAVIFKVDYDNADDLIKKYGVTYQHTFVLVDSAGKVLERWTGGGFDEILKRLV